jgi:hypothetical protein
MIILDRRLVAEKIDPADIAAVIAARSRQVEAAIGSTTDAVITVTMLECTP